MPVDLDRPTEETKRLQGCIDDLAALHALSASWTGRAPSFIGRTLLDALGGMLSLDLLFIRLPDPAHGAPVEMTRAAPAWSLAAHEGPIGQMLDRWLGKDLREWVRPVRQRTDRGEWSIVPLPLGLASELGVLVAGSNREDFPRENERLVLSAAANLGSMGLRQARLLEEQERLSETLREIEHESRMIVDNIPGPIGLLSPTGYVDVVNRQLLEYFGQTLEELREWGTNGTVHPEDLPHVAEVFSRSILSETPYTIVQRFRRWDGAYRWFENSGFPLRDGTGQVVRWCVLLTDIDERKRAEDALKRSERDLKLIIDTIPAMAWSAHPDGSAEFFNQHYLEFVGMSAGQASNWGWTAALHPDDLNNLAVTWQRIRASEAPGETEARLRRHDGEYRWFLFRANPLRDESGRIVKWYGTNIDIDDLKQAEHALRRSEAFLVEGQRLSRVGSFAWRVATGEITWSEQVYRMFEFEPGTRITLELIGSRVHPEDVPFLHDMAERAQQGVSDFEYEHRLLLPDDSVKYLHLIAHGTRDEQGRLEYIGAVQDVTDRRRAQEELDRARSELTRVARVTSLGTLAASIAHEVNQPLSGIVTNASTCLRMLAADPPNLDGARETARRTIRDGHRASDVINRLRGLFTRKEVVTESVDLNAATREVLALTASELRQGGVVVREELADGLPPLTGDRVQLQQVILNLLLNAADAMSGVEDRPREVVVRTGRDEAGAIRLSVQDSGIGFAPSDRDRLFDAFYTTKSQGMGIGLSVSRSVIERHGGQLWAVPNDGPGATFSFSLWADADTKV